MSDQPSAGDRPPTDAIEEIREQIDRIDDATATLAELGDREGLPVVERTARRIDGVLAALDRNVPPELEEE